MKISPIVKTLLIIDLLWAIAGLFGGSLLDFYLYESGITFFDLIIANTIGYVSPLVLIIMLNQKKTKIQDLMIFGMVITVIAYLIFALFPITLLLVYIAMFMIGFNSFLYFTQFNILYFQESKDHEGFFSSVYFSMGTIVELLIPIIVGYIAYVYGFFYVFLITVILLLFSVNFILKLEKKEFKYDLMKCLYEKKGFKMITLILGVYEGCCGLIVVLLALTYFTEPLDLGIFLSFTTLVSVIASLLIGHFSDLSRKRFRYIKYFGIGLAITNFLAFFSSNVFLFYVFMSLRNVFASLFYPFTTAIFADSKRNMKKIMIGREFVLNAGRVLGAFLTLLIYQIVDLRVGFIFGSILILLYVHYANKNKLVIKKGWETLQEPPENLVN